MTTRDRTRRPPDEPREFEDAPRGLRPRVRGRDRDRDRDRDRPSGPGLPERLHAAREEKGVDLYRAERDTKIRARYLAALERGDYRELPGAVYTKGFLRNYALYLGLDPDDVMRQWKRERGDSAVGGQPVLAVPRPLQAPRQGLTISRWLVVTASLFVVVLGFAGFIALQLMRFAQPPTFAVSVPDAAVVDVAEDTTTYVFRGTSIPGATISIAVPGRDQPYSVSADSAGRWTAEVELRRGRNQFDVTALDPETGKTAETTARYFITVPFPVVEAPTLTVDSPASGASFENGAIPVRGSTQNATTVVISAEYLGPTEGQPVVSPAPDVTPPAVAPVTLEVGQDGQFQAPPLDLATGRWRIVVTATSDEGKSVSLSREVAVAYRGVNLVITIGNSRAWIKVWVDDKVSEVTGAGRVYQPGKVLTFTAGETIEVRTGSSGATLFTLNGQDLGALGKSGIPETWLFTATGPPTLTERR